MSAKCLSSYNLKLKYSYFVGQQYPQIVQHQLFQHLQNNWLSYSQMQQPPPQWDFIISVNMWNPYQWINLAIISLYDAYYFI